MKKINLMRIVLLITSAFLLAGVAILLWIHSWQKAENVIDIHLQENVVETVAFENLCLLPGEQCSYSVSLSSEKAQQYDVKLEFVELEEKSLKNFAYVKLEADGKVICDLLLAEAFEAEAILLPVDFAQNSNTELTVTYYMPIEVGNEAENAEALFELRVVASNE